ncbi:MAG TPA: hypothetical protein DCG75_17490 [Bacteroidales bacterium]|nr:hypothetical protein [Bacteroidales bacterium]
MKIFGENICLAGHQQWLSSLFFQDLFCFRWALLLNTSGGFTKRLKTAPDISSKKNKTTRMNLKKLNIKNYINSHFFKQITGFSIVGIFVTVFSLGLLYLCIDIIKLNVYFSYIFVYLISIGFSYLLNGKLVFKSSLSLQTYLLYYGIYISGMGLGLLIIKITKYLFSFNDFINSICATPFTMLWNFLLISYVFNKYQGNKIKENFSESI